jgi:hypothetical protein
VLYILCICRILSTVCSLCSETGASVRCQRRLCRCVYHLKCAMACNCTFKELKAKLGGPHDTKSEENDVILNDIYYTMVCPSHQSTQKKSVIHIHPNDYTCRCLKAYDGDFMDSPSCTPTLIMEKHANELRLGSRALRIGSLTIHKLGSPSLEDAGHHSTYHIFPIGYRSCRIFWSMKYPMRRTLYTFEVSIIYCIIF